jgi:hypothetical protein
LLLGGGAALQAEEDGSAAIAAKTLELAPSNSPTPARIISLHRFVRDEIRQVPTQYG